MQNIIDNALEYVKVVFETDYSGHDFFHTFRVYKMATNIAIKEKANLEIVQLAALLHDVDDVKLSPETHTNKDKARSFLTTNNVRKTTIEAICQIIDEISYKGNDSVIPKTLEGRCVQDSDRLKTTYYLSLMKRHRSFKGGCEMIKRLIYYQKQRKMLKNSQYISYNRCGR